MISRTMKILVLGGTVFLSREVAVAARDRGHEVTCAARGVSGAPPPEVRFVRVDRSRPDGLGALAGENFDAVVDVARQSVSQVRDAVRVLGDRTSHWTYVSTRSVYADKSVAGLTAAALLVEPATDDTDEADPENYGRLKVAAEGVVLSALGDRAFIPRPGLVVGRGDVSDRYGYWPARLSRGGDVLYPGEPGAWVQMIDVRDLAAWIVLAAEQRLMGVFDAVGPPLRFGDIVAQTAAVTAAADTRSVWVSDAFLLEHGVNPWMGERSLPLWLPQAELAGMGLWDVSTSLAAGLTIRPISESASDALDWERQLGLDRPRNAGLTPADEAALLAAWGARSGA
jgi:2'-hydroxyisoflavone reductase